MAKERGRARWALAAVCWVLAAPVWASHENAETILGQWDKWASRRQQVEPAPQPRPLESAASAPPALITAAQSAASGVMALMVLDKGTVVFETYSQGATAASRLNAYSMTKSMTALAVGEALCAGKIHSLDDAAKTYAPVLAGTAYGEATVRQLLAYTSGAQDPGGDGYAGIHDGRDFGAVLRWQLSLVDLMKKYGEIRAKPGERFVYNGLNSEALSLVVRGATDMPLASWFGQTVWRKAGAELSAGWFADRDGNSLAEVAFLATTRDYARVGLYVLERLTGQSADTCMNAFVKEAATPVARKAYWKAAPQFGLGLHVGADGNTWIMGHGGQRIGINARSGRVVVSNGAWDWRELDDALQRLLAY
ncbi:serine hydrolase domain-containing protein [Curvibacter sp. APW13]|uniref:serine hydrolase domain-containing protein n=1 Tax=Curvibacter sp. APW13 TaxID=3077236 RepID=UPI0028DEFE2C|nr:serine hydrolase domain-containing protein [Curvibacter sp. APW13]MDT8991294.1 serine hydrolase domain-containing protein [Curvibacter sp. APW13]